jgi:hypothetical protein
VFDLFVEPFEITAGAKGAAGAGEDDDVAVTRASSSCISSSTPFTGLLPVMVAVSTRAFSPVPRVKVKRS